MPAACISYDFRSQNLWGATLLLFLAMLYMAIMLLNMIMTNKYIALGSQNYVFGGAFISPLLFILGDIIAELYGYNLSKRLIWIAFSCQTIFVVGVRLVMMTQAPDNWHHEAAFDFVLGSLLRVNLSSFFAFVMASLINAYILTKWKAILKGRYFWLRSLGSSTFSEALYSAFAIVMIAFDQIPTHDLYKIIIITYLIKAVYSIIFAFPGNLLVFFLNNLLKENESITIENTPIKHTF